MCCDGAGSLGLTQAQQPGSCAPLLVGSQPPLSSLRLSLLLGARRLAVESMEGEVLPFLLSWHSLGGSYVFLQR